MSWKAAITASTHTLPAFAAMGMFWGAFAAFMPEIKSGIEASDGVFGMVMLVGASGAILAMWVAPVVAMRLGSPAMALGIVLMGLAFQAVMVMPSVIPFALMMLLASVTTGMLDIVMNSEVSRSEARSGRSLMNLNHAGFSFAYGLTALAVGLAREVGLSPQSVYLALLLVTIPLAVFTYVSTGRQRDGLSAEGSDRAGQGALPKAVYWGGAIVLIAFLAENAVEGWSALHIERELGGGAAEGAFGPAILGLTMGVGRLSGQVLVAHQSPARLLGFAALVSAAGTFLAAIAAAPALAWLGFGIMGLGVAAVAPMALALIGQKANEENRMRAISRAAVIGYAGFFIGPPLMGFVAEASSLRISFLLVAGVLVVVPLLVRPLRKG